MVVLIAGVGSLMLLMLWVGWRFFLPHSAAPVVVAVPSPAGVPAATPASPKKRWPQLPVQFQWLGDRFLLAMLVVAAGAVIGVLAIASWVRPAPLSAERLARQDHIELTFNPERLVPPPPLPPSMFISTERPELEGADRDWAKLSPSFMQNVLRLFKRLEERGYNFVLLEGYRSPERQDALALMGQHVTNARAFQSRHQHGLAADIAPMREGRLVISEKDPWALEAYKAMGEEAEKLGLTWGGRWSMRDYGHVETAGQKAVAR